MQESIQQGGISCYNYLMPIHHSLHKIKKTNTDYLDSTMSVVAFISPFAVTPQILQIYQTKDVQGISLVTWIISILSSVIWLAYGLHHKDKPIIFNSILGTLFCSMITVGILIYR
jgi:uncharacterized protein with PQ loop repeat